MTAGYWRRADLYEEQFTGDWFRTGDIGKIDEAGYSIVLDRKKDMIIRGGFNIYSAEIERVLSDHPAVAEATVVGAPRRPAGRGTRRVRRALVIRRATATHSPTTCSAPPVSDWDR